MSIKINNLIDFNIEQTLECGQCFNFEKISEMEYAVVYKNRILHVKQEESTLLLLNGAENDRLIWEEYFDLNRDYGKIKEFLLDREPRLRDSIEKNPGVRILNQEFYEMLISFIISQNKNISHIKQIIRTISERYGEVIGEINGRKYYSFPSIEKLGKLTEEHFIECKTGFRAPYLKCAVDKLNSGELDLDKLQNMSEEEVRNSLLKIKGVGEKITNCVLLFGLGYRDAFPVDVWIKRIMEEMYFEKETSIEVIQKFAKEKFGEYGGYAQQYLFYYAREKKIGKKTSKN